MTDSTAVPPFLSFVIPVKDEEKTIEPLFEQIREVMRETRHPGFEVIFIDDGSNDDSWSVMQQLAAKNRGEVLALRLRRNFGKAVALDCGFRASSGEIIFTMDADLQDDPREIPQFLAKLDAGNDVVSGWKQRRQDPLSKTLPSRLFNRVTAAMTGIPLHDFNCGFKAYRREVLENVRLYGELHRYIPVLAFDSGFRIGEIPVAHHPRTQGVSKYGWERYARGLVDLITVLATTRYLHKPGHLFGGLGLAAGTLGSAILLYLTVLWFLGLGPIGTRPLFFLAVLLEILCIQLVSLGVLAELVTRHSSGRQSQTLIAEQTGKGGGKNKLSDTAQDISPDSSRR